MKRSILLCVLSLVVLLGLAAPPGAHAATYTVTNAGDTVNGGTLRWAISSANTNPGADTIAFDLSSPYFIQRTGDVERITDPVVIDGTTQLGYPGTPIVHICGKQAGMLSGHGLHIQADTCTVKGLIVSAFYQIGVYVDRAEHCTVQGNYLMSNTYGGVYMVGATNVLIGGTNSLQRNVISANEQNGVQSVAGGSNIVIIGNYIGTDASGLVAAPNCSSYPYHAVNIGGSTRGVRIGGTKTGEGNVISGNDGVGIYCMGVTGLVVEGNYIGVDATGTNDLGNTGDGVCISGVSNVIGGLVAAARNIISGNGDDGVQLFGETSRGNLVQGNYIGTDVSGLVGVTNAMRGVNIWGAPFNTVGGSVPAARNIIGASQWDGMYICETGSVDNIVCGNYINTDVTGSNAFSTHTGIDIHGALRTVIGGTGAGDGNVISGCKNYGVSIGGGATGTVVQGNYIGTDASGTLAISNGSEGIIIMECSDCLVGGTNASARNVISGNGSHGIYLGTLYRASHVIQGNYIGADATGTNALPNAGCGIIIYNGSSNTIGGSVEGAGNLVAHNGGDGVQINQASAVANPLLGNRIFSNKGMGIDLIEMFAGPTGNDYQDADTGPNNLQNYPVLTSVSNNGANLVVKGTLNSTPNSSFRIEFFGSAACDLSTYGEGENCLGFMEVNSDGNGNASFTNSALSTPTPPPNFITATATDTNTLDTSEFSQRVLLDSDGDGMGDGYEHVNFGNYLAGLAAGDADTDGVLNLWEFYGDTDPWESNDFLCVLSIKNAGAARTVICESSSDRIYALQGSTNLPSEPAWFSIGPDVDGNGGLLTLDGTLGYPFCTYRIGARVP